MTTGTVTPRAGGDAISGAPPSALTLHELVDDYMAAYTGRDTARAYRLARWVSLLGAHPLATLTDDDVFHALEAIAKEPARVYHGRDADGRPIHREKGKRKPATLNRYHAALAAVCTWAIKRRRAPKGWENPCRSVERQREDNQVVRFLDETERARLLEACRRSAWRPLYALVLLGITTGARRGELLGLTWPDVNLEHATALVRTTKNGEPKMLPLVSAAVEALRRLRRKRKTGLIFASRIRPDVAYHIDAVWAAALREAKIRAFRFHDLRHTCASYLAQQGASLLEIADVMGHRQLAMVKRYSHLTVQSKAKLVNRVLGEIR
jgi:integrase